MDSFTLYNKDINKLPIEEVDSGFKLIDRVTESFKKTTDMYTYLHNDNRHLIAVDNSRAYSGLTYENNLPIDKQGLLTLIKRVFKNSQKMSLNLDISDYEEDCFDKQLMYPKNLSCEQYFNLLDTYYDEIYALIISVSVFQNGSHYEFLNSAAVQVTPRKEDTELHIRYVCQMLTGLDSHTQLDTVNLTVKDLKPHKHSKLHLLLNYLEDNWNDLPKDVQDAYNLSKGDLEMLAHNYKDLKVYK